MRKQILLFLGSLLLASNIYCQSREEVYAGVMFYIIRYVEWPNTNTDKITIAVANDKKLANTLNELVQNKKVHFKSVEVKNESILSGTDQFDAIFFTKKSLDQLAALDIKKIEDNNVLVITEGASGSSSKHSINFIERNGKLKLELALDRMQAANIKASQQLKKLSEVNQ